MAAQNIDGTAQGTGVYNTKVPGYEDAADIQVALKLFLYGDANFDPSVQGAMDNLPNPSIARYMKVMQDEINALQNAGIGSSYGNEPTAPTTGYIWMPDTTQPIVPLVQAAIYQPATPTTNLVNGLIWIKQGSTPLKQYVYDATSSTWKEIGA